MSGSNNLDLNCLTGHYQIALTFFEKIADTITKTYQETEFLIYLQYFIASI